MKHSRLLLLIAISIFLSSCAGLLGSTRDRHYKSTSLVQFLYPKGSVPPEDNPQPILHLPLKVGLAFVPDRGSYNSVPISLKTQLLQQVKFSFEQKQYIDEIIIIPDLYLQNSSGYNSLQQVKSLYQLDVIALVSYDQLVRSKENLLALSYLSIVGSYVFPGTGYNVSTLIDLAVVDVNSRSILFRAAGSSASKGATADAYSKQTYDRKQSQGFEKSMESLLPQLNLALNQFEHRLRNPSESERIQVKNRKGYSGSSSGFLLLLILSLCIFIKRVENG